MKEIIPVTIGARERLEADLLVAGCFEGTPPEADGLGEPHRAALLGLAARPGWKGREEQSAETAVAAPGRGVVCLQGLGRRRDFTFRKLAGWITRVAEAARTNGVAHLAFLLPRHAETTGGAAAERVLRLLALADYRFDRFLGEASRPAHLERITVLPPAGEEAAYAAALDPCGPLAAAVAYARDLGNAPSNEATPAWFEERSRELAAGRGMEITVLGRDELELRGMGGLLAVGAGSAHEPRLVRLAWGRTGPAIALVGKGVTFDAGGISIKPATNMEEMRYDKCGACAAMGALRAAADLDLPVRLRVYLAVAENVLDSNSFRPGDIIRCYNGKTVETVNTDAEGRLILADAMAWAAEEGPEALVELSTLTGACVVALGHHAAGLFTPDDRLAAELLAAGEQSGERIWRLPVLPEYLEEMKGAHADLRNSATRAGSASTAAAFLSQFVGEVEQWAHLDIAGVNAIGRDQNRLRQTGATGFGVALTIAWLRQRLEGGGER